MILLMSSVALLVCKLHVDLLAATLRVDQPDAMLHVGLRDGKLCLPPEIRF